MQALRRRSFTIVVIAACAGAAVALRWPLYVRSEALLLGWNSDTAIYGLMARAMVETRRPIFLFWGQDYLGTLTSLWTLAASSVTGSVGPLALRLGAFAQVAVALALLARVIANAWGKVAAVVAVVWLIAGPRWFFEMTYAPLSAEQMFLTGALILWYASRKPFTRLSQWFTLGMLGGAGWWAHRGSMFALIPAIVAIVVHDDGWRETVRAAKAMAAGMAGMAIGVVPLWAGRAAIDQRLYQPLTAPLSLFDIAGRMADAVRTDLWVFLSGSNSGFGIAVGLVVLVFAVIGLRGSWVGRAGLMLTGVVVVVAGFWLLSPEVYSGATRYLMLALPVIYGLAGRGAVTLSETGSRPRILAVSLVLCAIAVHFYDSRMTDVSEIAAARREDHHQWRSFDPRPALQAIGAERYRVCYADFWAAYKLEWLSDTGVRFIPYRSVNRTQTRSLALAGLPVPKCYVDSGGRVLRLGPEEVRAMRAELLITVPETPSHPPPPPPARDPAASPPTHPRAARFPPPPRPTSSR